MSPLSSASKPIAVCRTGQTKPQGAPWRRPWVGSSGQGTCPRLDRPRLHSRMIKAAVQNTQGVMPEHSAQPWFSEAEKAKTPRPQVARGPGQVGRQRECGTTWLPTGKRKQILQWARLPLRPFPWDDRNRDAKWLPKRRILNTEKSSTIPICRKQFYDLTKHL